MADTRDVLRAVQSIPLFSTLQEDEVWEILRCCEHFSVPAGTVLFEQGSPGSSAFILSSGKVEIRLRGDRAVHPVARFGPGDVFGELALIDASERSADAVVVEDAVYYELRGDRFQQLRQAMHPAAYKVLRHLARIVARRLREVNHRIEDALLGDTPREVRTARLTPAPGVLDDPKRQPSTTEGVEAEAEPGFFRRMFARIWGQGEDA
jgi:CRP-like cAMP-binding protein